MVEEVKCGDFGDFPCEGSHVRVKVPPDSGAYVIQEVCEIMKTISQSDWKKI